MPADVGLFGGLACLLGQHVRSRGQARARPEGWVSRCARCGIPMVRAHGGGKWQVIKAPKRTQRDDPIPTEELFAKAISRSRQAGIRKDEKEALAAQKALADEAAATRRHVVASEGEQPESEPEQRAAGRFWRRKRVGSDVRPKRMRRFLAFRKTATDVEAGDIAEPSIDTDGVPQPGKTSRKLFRRRQRRDADAE